MHPFSRQTAKELEPASRLPKKWADTLAANQTSLLVSFQMPFDAEQSPCKLSLLTCQ